MQLGLKLAKLAKVRFGAVNLEQHLLVMWVLRVVGGDWAHALFTHLRSGIARENHIPRGWPRCSQMGSLIGRGTPSLLASHTESRTRRQSSATCQASRRVRASLVGRPKVIFEISSIGPRIPFSRPKMSPENAWWRHFCEETAPCGRKSAFLPTACVREYITLFFSMSM